MILPIIRRFFKNLANLKLAILILLAIAIVTSIGSIIEQSRDIQFYQNTYTYSLFGMESWRIILLLGLNSIYSTWWFFFLLFIFGLSLSCCTILQQLPTLKFSRRYYFYKQKSQFSKLSVKIKRIKVFRTHLSYALIRKQYSLFQQYNTIYAYKGLISRIGPIVVHFSIICILLGSTLGALTGFNSQELIPETEIFHTQNIIKTGLFSSVPQKTFRINDFWAIYNINNQIKQFYSDISVLNGKGSEFRRKTISVNNPLLINELIIYQTDWGILGIRLNLIRNDFSNTVIQLPILKLNNFSSQKLWMSSLTSRKENVILLIKNNRGQIALYEKEGKFIKNINLGENLNIIDLDLRNINLIDIISSTGIQIKSDPGVKLLYIGFLFLIISSLISYISFSELWLLEFTNQVMFGGKTNRAQVKFKVEFLRFQQSFIKNNFYK
uniref:Cytochrome c biogenesis protein CcsB n=1 Tax=Protohalopteris sp. TaxID=2843287 RepID=A0A8F0F705_9PHAE|nr:cytochrome biogenesis protein [Protohalopteris sp.]